MELTREHIAINDLIIIDEGISAYIETWFDVDEKFSIHTGLKDYLSVDFYSIYNPDNDFLKCAYIIKNDRNDKRTEHKYCPTPSEAALIKTMMEELCQAEDDCDLRDLWAQRNGE